MDQHPYVRYRRAARPRSAAWQVAIVAISCALVACGGDPDSDPPRRAGFSSADSCAIPLLIGPPPEAALAWVDAAILESDVDWVESSDPTEQLSIAAAAIARLDGYTARWLSVPPAERQRVLNFVRNLGMVLHPAFGCPVYTMLLEKASGPLRLAALEALGAATWMALKQESHAWIVSLLREEAAAATTPAELQSVFDCMRMSPEYPADFGPIIERASELARGKNDAIAHGIRLEAMAAQHAADPVVWIELLAVERQSEDDVLRVLAGLDWRYSDVKYNEQAWMRLTAIWNQRSGVRLDGLLMNLLSRAPPSEAAKILLRSIMADAKTAERLRAEQTLARMERGEAWVDPRESLPR